MYPNFVSGKPSKVLPRLWPHPFASDLLELGTNSVVHLASQWLHNGTYDVLFGIFGLEGSRPDTGGICCQSVVNYGLGTIDLQALTTPTISVIFFGFSVSPPIIPASVVLEEVTNCS